MNLKRLLNTLILLSLISLMTSCATDFHRTPYMGYEKKVVWCIKDFISIGVGPPNANTICHDVYKRPIDIKEVRN